MTKREIFCGWCGTDVKDGHTDECHMKSAPRRRPELQPCGHPIQAIRSSPYIADHHSNWCGWCEEVGQLNAEVARLGLGLTEPAEEGSQGMDKKKWRELAKRRKWLVDAGNRLIDYWKTQAEEARRELRLCAALSTPADDWLVEVLKLKGIHRGTWRDEDEAHWFDGLREEVEELGLSLKNFHEHSPQYELTQIAAICLNWLEHRGNRQSIAADWLAQHDAEVRREERERCAKIAEGWCRCSEPYPSMGLIDPGCDAHDIAGDIRESTE